MEHLYNKYLCEIDIYIADEVIIVFIAPYTQYNFSVTGVNSVGKGPSSSTTRFSTPQGGTLTITVLYITHCM